MATFHPFPRLPLELRIQIWEFATVDRVVRIERIWSRRALGYWSPTPVPAVTRACRESREYCSYQKAFKTDSSPRYIWANFDSDIIHVRTELFKKDDYREKHPIRHLRIALVDQNGDESQFFYHEGILDVGDFLKLERVDVLVNDELWPAWTDSIKETYWGACPKGNVRIVDANTGEWIDEKTSKVYWDYRDTSGGEHDSFTRILDDDEDEEDRIEAMKRLQIPLPRIDLDY